MKVLMIGAGRDVRGGVSSVVNGYYDAGLDRRCRLVYLPTMEDGSRWRKLRVAVRARIRFEKLIRRADILHVHMSSDNSFYRKAVFIRKAYREKKKIVIHMHGSTFDLFYRERCNERQRAEVRRIFAMADKVIALSEEWEQFLAEYICDKEKIQVIYNAVRLPDSFEKDYDSLRMLFLGILGKRKGVYDLIRVLPDIFRKYPDAHLYFCGDGEREQAERLCTEQGIADHVTFCGWVRGEEKKKLLQECSVYVLPTYHEGMPMSVLEAMSYGLAVASTYAGGIPRMITDGKNGLLSKAGDRDALKRNLSQILKDRERREMLGRAAAETVEKRFNLKRNVELLLDMYARILP